ncbi:MAG: porphobilinogen synthase, partial [Gammaproteobacteria bacterium]
MQFPDRKYPAFRARRMRRSAFSRSLMRENRLCAADF